MVLHDCNGSEWNSYNKIIEGLTPRLEQLRVPPVPASRHSAYFKLLDLEGQTALITGGASGIGAATARALLTCGARVVIADMSAENGEQLLSSEPEAVEDHRLHFVHTDVREPELCRNAVAACISKTNRVDLLITSAGIVIPDQHPLNYADYQRIMNVNVWGTMCMIDAVKDLFKQQRRGTIVTIGSIVASHGWPNRMMYCASKGAAEAAMRSCALELAQYGVKVNCVAPGLTWTPLMKKVVENDPIPATAFRSRAVQQAFGSMFTPEQIAHYILFLASPLSDGLCGAVLDASGGRLAGHVPDVENPGVGYDYEFESTLKR